MTRGIASYAVFAATGLSLLGLTCATGTRVDPIGAMTPPPSGEEWIDLLDQANQMHWKETTGRTDIFTIEDGVLHIPGRWPTRYVGYMGQEFGDFELHIEFRMSKGCNSGVLFRAQPDDPPMTGAEIQVLEDGGAPPTRHNCGALYDVATPMFNPSLPPGEWNSFDIRLADGQLETKLNGIKVLDIDFSQLTVPLGKFDFPYAELPETGYFFLQDHGGEIWYRNIWVRPL